MLEVSQSGIDLVNSGVDSDETRMITALLNRPDPFNNQDVINTLQGMGVSTQQAGILLNHLVQRGYLTSYQDNPGPSVPTGGNPTAMTQEGVPSVLPTGSQTAQAEASGAIPSVLPGKPRTLGSPVERGVRQEQVGAKEKFQKLLTPRGVKA